MVPSKFGVNWPFGSGEEAKNRFSRWRPWQPSWISDRNDFRYFRFTSHPDASYQVSSQLAQGCRRSRLLKQLLTPHDGQRTTDDRYWLTTIAHHEHFVLRWANKISAAAVVILKVNILFLNKFLRNLNLHIYIKAIYNDMQHHTSSINPEIHLLQKSVHCLVRHVYPNTLKCMDPASGEKIC